MNLHPFPLLAGLCLAALGLPAQAAGSKLLLTGGVSSIDGAAGGGLTPWALTGSYAGPGEWGGSAFVTAARTSDYGLRVAGAAVAWDERLEFSIARQRFDTRQNLAPLGLGGLQLEQDILGAKWRVAGDAVLDADRWMPQIALGALHRRSQAGAFAPTLFGPLGARRSDTELYAAATKLWLQHSLLTNLTLRATRANQNGLLGFGGAQDRRWRLQPELSVALLLAPQLALGVEARAKPNALNRSVLGTGALAEDDWFDAFLAFAPNKHLSFTAAAVDLGRIAPALQPRRQRGAYLSVQLSF
ncbi:DUF3034 family protein [Inhella proteolytica]|uniref:DUF3034 family protein n=1 Tax=Inhella proteolytica TaxID=2795029 RepID=A0A931J7F4_9BURK|nr:DUF3034 family protein [Inhella proteolytica]MBH9577515.1 DUF3034 family protein [Inhella proteolytica]